MIFFIRRALQDMNNNKFLHIVTIIIITLSILIVSAFSLFFINANDLMESWKKGIRIMAYIQKNTPEVRILDLKLKIAQTGNVKDVRFISKEEALELLKNQMGQQRSLLNDLNGNPLPDAIEVKLKASIENWEEVEAIAARIESYPLVEDVEYGQKLIGRFTNIFQLFRFIGIAMGVVFFMASVFIVANTIRLLFYSRHDEFEIMRLVGATDGFIKAPFYIEGIIQGAIGGIIGITVLFISFWIISSNIDQGFSSYFFSIRFLPFKLSFGIIICSMFAGWLGCFLSLKQFLKT